MKRLAFVVLVLFSFQQAYSQENPVEDKQFLLWIDGVGSEEQVTHYISAVGKVWERNGSNYVISSDQSVYDNSLATTGNADFDNINWPGFNFKWLNEEPALWPSWGLGFYKVTNTAQTDKYFYLDARDNNYGDASTQEFWIYFNNFTGLYNHDNASPLTNWITISNGSIVRIWEIRNTTPSTSGLQNFWSNALVGIPSSNDDTPRIAWGPYSSFTATGYKIYRSINTSGGAPGSFSLLQTINNGSVYEFTDVDLALGSPWKVYYKVKAFNSTQESNFTNTVSFDVSGFLKEKGSSETSARRFDYALSQNFPNPFNPSTMIKFDLPKKSKVSFEIYDVLGQRIATLLHDEERESGSHAIMWDGKHQNGHNLPGGVYFYRLRAGEIVLTKKLTLIR